MTLHMLGIQEGLFDKSESDFVNSCVLNTMPSTFLHTSSFNLHSNPSYCTHFPRWKREVTRLTPGHTASMQNTGSGQEASDLSLATLGSLCGEWGLTCEALVRATGQVLGGIFQQGVQVLRAGRH